MSTNHSTKNVIPNFKSIIKSIVKESEEKKIIDSTHASEIYRRIKEATGLKKFELIYKEDEELKEILRNSQGKFIQLLISSNQQEDNKHCNLRYLNQLFNSFAGQPLNEWKPQIKCKRSRYAKQKVAEDTEQNMDQSSPFFVVSSYLAVQQMREPVESIYQPTDYGDREQSLVDDGDLAQDKLKEWFDLEAPQPEPQIERATWYRDW